MRYILTISLFALVASCFFVTPVLAADEGSPATSDALESVENFSQVIGIIDADDDPRVLIGRVISIAIGVVGSLALVIVVYGGIMWMTAGGNDSKVAKAQKTIMWGFLGLVVVLLSYVIVRAILDKVIGITNL